MKKSIFVLIMLCCCLLFMVACASDEGTDTPADTDTDTPADTDTDTGTDDTVYELKISCQDSAEVAVTHSVQRAIDAIYEQTDGHVVITPYYSGVLGDYITIFEDLQKSALDMAQISYTDTNNQLFNVMMVPYSVTSWDQGEKLWDPQTGDFFAWFKQGADECGVDLISCTMAGFLGVSGSYLGDMTTILDPTIKQEGCVIRVPAMESFVALGESMGFSVTTIAFADVYSALQTGVCDGVIGTPVITAWESYRDVVNYWVEFKYILENVWITARPDLKDDLPADYYQTISDAFYDEFFASIDEAQTGAQEAMDNLEEYGCEIMTPTAEELQPMQDYMVENLWPQFADFFSDYGGQEFLDGLLASIEAAK